MRVRGAEVACGSQGAASRQHLLLSLFCPHHQLPPRCHPPMVSLSFINTFSLTPPIQPPTSIPPSSCSAAGLTPLLRLCSGQSPPQPVSRSAIERHVPMLKDYAFLGLHVLQFGGFLARLEALRVQCAVLGA